MFDEKIQALQELLLDFNEQIQSIQAKADAEKRDLSEDEEKELEGLFAKFEQAEADIKTRERIIAQTDKLAQRMGRKTEPQGAEDEDGAQARADGRPNKRTADIRAPFEDKGKGGFRNLGEFASAVRMASRAGNVVDPRLLKNAPSTYSQEGVGEDGGFAVPPDFRTTIMEKVMGVESLLSRTDGMTTTSNHITFPKDETTPWGSAGIQAYWDGEAAQLQQSKVQLGEETLKLNRLTALVPVTEELLQDAPSLDAYLRRKVPERFDWKIQDSIINGTGVGMPLGILNADCLVTVPKVTNTSPIQAADTILYRNIVDMTAQLYAPCMPRAVWLINQQILPQLYTMAFDPNAESKVPVYLPANGAAGAPFGTLMGRPVLPIEACKPLGDVGDIILADLSQYMTITKVGGVRQDISIHLWFDYATTAYRFIFRMSGQPWWKSAITPANPGSPTKYLGCFVTLAAR